MRCSIDHQSSQLMVGRRFAISSTWLRNKHSCRQHAEWVDKLIFFVPDALAGTGRSYPTTMGAVR